MLKKRFIFIGYLITATAALLFCIQCSRNGNKGSTTENTEASKWQNLGDSARYVGMNTCRSCHEGVYQSFIKTGMGKSFGPATKQRSAANFHNNAPLYDKYKDLYYLPYWQDSLLTVKEYRLKGRDTIYSRIEHINYIIGSGHHTNSHIINEKGYLYQAPFTFFTQKGEWDFPPGFENGYNSRFSREIGIECMSCHNSLPGFENGSVNKYSFVPDGIGCERCHGPGSIHVKNKLAGNLVDTSKGPDYTIVNPKKLPYKLQIDVCQRCHLQGDAVLKPGKTFFDFKPGMKLSTVMDEFLPVYQNQNHDFLMASHAERLQKSQCFLQTQNLKNGEQLNCITCHNPHISVKYTSEQFFLDKCNGCHKNAHNKDPQILQTAGSNCISCHMPPSTAIDIPHVTITDHYIRVVKPEKDNGAIGIGKFEGLSSVNDKHPDSMTVAKAYMYFYEKFEHRTENLDSAYKYLQSFSSEKYAIEYIYYYYQRNNDKMVVNTAVYAKSPLNDAVCNYQVGQAYFNLRQLPQAIIYLKKAVDLQPYNLNYHVRLATAYTFAKDFSSAEGEINFVLKENPKIASAWNGLAFIDLATNRFDEAKINLKKTFTLDPDYEPGHINMVKYFIALNKFKEAKTEINEILKRNPNSLEAKAQKELLDKAGI